MNGNRNHIALLLVLAFILLAACYTRKEQSISLKTIPPVLLKKNGAELFQYWEFRNTSFLWDTNFIQPASLKGYKDSVSNILGKDSFHQITLARVRQDSSFKSVITQNGDSINEQLIHTNRVGKIRPINYLESELVDYQLSRYALLSHPTEFHGFILLNDSLGLVRVYFAASDQPWPPKHTVILQAVKTDLTHGWTFKYHLHNHYEPMSNHYLGILAPSMTDAQYYVFLKDEYNLEQSLITNGFHTVEIKKEEFVLLTTPETNFKK